DNLHVLVAQGLLPNGDEPLCQFWIVVSRRTRLVFRYADNRLSLWWDSTSGGDPFGDSLNSPQHMFPHFGLISTYCELHLHFVRNDVVLRSAVNRAHRNDNGVERIIFAACDGLPGID